MKKIIIIVIVIILVLICGLLVYKSASKKTEPNIIENSIISNSVVSNIVYSERDVEPRTIESSEDVTKITFEENEYLAIGYINKNKEEEFIKKYFKNKSEYNSLPVIDAGDNFKFIIIPKEGIKINVSKCSINEEGNAETYDYYGEDLSKPFILTTEEFEYAPTIALEVFSGEYGTLIPLMFSGIDNRLVFSGNDSSVVDISIY